MATHLKAESTLTDRYQTTVPETVRRALSLRKRDRIRYAIQPDGSVVLSRVEDAAAEADPALDAFLGFLERDMAGHPARLHSLGQDLAERVRSLVGGVEVDLDAPLSADDE